ncbi:MAG TPA: alpha-glucosidase [Terriglobales bacterium]|nr:alpha-glucosidase [Terriglobales bacterium]
MRKQFLSQMLILPAAFAALLISSSFAQSAPKQAGDNDWWKHAVFYELYPRSFADSNNDGFGDLRGITSKMDYLKQLGVDAIWLTPCYPSPQVDFGYDISDYENIDPTYGTLQDFDSMEKEGQKRGIRIIMDFVLNHTSDQHPWFIASRSSRTSPYRNWYIWRDGKGPHQPPNNWNSLFGGPAWQWDTKTSQYYYHFFYPQQPDLNWRNPAVEKAMFDVTRWWYKRGVAGFRLDAVDTLFEDPQLHDNPVLPGKNQYGDPNEENKYDQKLPQVHQVLRALRKVADENHAVLIGETYTDNLEQLKQYYGDNQELQMPMDMMLGLVNKISAPAFRHQIALAESSGGWPVYVMNNHDIARSYNRYGDGKHNDAIAKLMAGLYLTLRGTPIMYYGEEIGMENNDPKRKEDVKDPIGKLGWPVNKGRDGERTPMQWSDGVNAGFTTATPWLPVPSTYKTHNVATESNDPTSILEFYRRLLALRHTNQAFLEGRYVPLNEDDPNVLCYLRQSNGQTVVVVLNMSGEARSVGLDLAKAGFTGKNRSEKTATTLLTTMPQEPGEVPLDHVQLDPFAVYIGSVR